MKITPFAIDGLVTCFMDRTGPELVKLFNKNDLRAILTEVLNGAAKSVEDIAFFEVINKEKFKKLLLDISGSL
ncbi:hypothetical protein ABDD95_19225 [Mucilaginibacter sp. PAMB04274]|uniref:hypothetical protein n=1 Tax=Mucilaginibacter sp. PAMB04274 TaxID=3138568 RepID=UPI0031F60EA2